jgi:hypothetical protein
MELGADSVLTAEKQVPRDKAARNDKRFAAARNDKRFTAARNDNSLRLLGVTTLYGPTE